ncbi:MAG: HAD family phosphatase [Bacteroidota bacterium]
MTTYKALIFDLGKVVFDVSFDRTFQYWANLSGKSFDEIKNNFKFDTFFGAFERGEISAQVFRESISKQLNLSLSVHDFDKGWCNLYLETYNGIDELLSHLKTQYKIVALTNTNIIHNEVWTVKYADTLKHFEKIFSSHEIKLRKPEKQSYQIVLDYLQLDPSQTVFLDDNMENIHAAQQLGIQSILVTTQVQMKLDLQQLGILNRSFTV